MILKYYINIDKFSAVVSVKPEFVTILEKEKYTNGKTSVSKNVPQR